MSEPGIAIKRAYEPPSAEDGARYLVSSSPEFVGSLGHSAGMWQSWHQLTACVREWVPGADVRVLDCRALGLNDNEMLEEVRRARPDVVFFGSMIPAAGGAAARHRPHRATPGGGAGALGAGLISRAWPGRRGRPRPLGRRSR